jgi:hypothetical protein
MRVEPGDADHRDVARRWVLAALGILLVGRAFLLVTRDLSIQVGRVEGLALGSLELLKDLGVVLAKGDLGNPQRRRPRR